MLTLTQLEQFEQDGMLVVPSVLDSHTLAQIRDSYACRVDDILTRAFIMEGQYLSRADFAEKITALICHAPQHYHHLDISLPMLSDMAAEVPTWQKLFGECWRQNAGFFGDDAVFNMLRHPSILKIAQQIIGDDINLSPVQHARIKPPQHLLPKSATGDANIARTLWHQDEAVITEAAKDSPILTVWIAITDATIENGCMYGVRGSHKRMFEKADFGLVRHCPGRKLAAEIYIADEDIDKDNLAPLQARAGDVILLHRRTIHGAGANQSAGIRWSFDLRYQPQGTHSGRDCFPTFALSGAQAIRSGKEYRQIWRQARDDIISGKTPAIFNERWNKYAAVCA